MSTTSTALPPSPVHPPKAPAVTQSPVETPEKPQSGAPLSDVSSTPTQDIKASNDDEPQNALTKKFTEAEWKALKELRVRLCQPASLSLNDMSVRRIRYKFLQSSLRLILIILRHNLNLSFSGESGLTRAALKMHELV